MTRHQAFRRASGGFTLFELVAVMVVMAILAGTVALSVRGRVSNARLESFLDRLEACDARARADARRWNQPVVLGFDSSEEGVSQLAVQGTSASTERSFVAPQGVDIAEIKTASEQLDHGTLQIAISPLGQSDTYALRVQASGGRGAWLVVLGGSGQVLRLEKGDDVDEVFSLQRDAIRYDAR